MSPPSPHRVVARYLAVGMADIPDDDQWLSPPEADRLNGFAYTKRRDEARLGRWTAKLALAKMLRLDEDPAVLRRLVIGNADSGAPEVFVDGRRAPISISLTDRADWAVCTVIGGGDRAIGCDLELVEPRGVGFVADYFTPLEQELVATAPTERDLLTNLIWSAKESALKVLRTGLRRDTRSVDVQVNPHEGGDAWSGLFVTTTEGSTFTGWWRRFDHFVFTYVSAVVGGPPASLLEPSPLISARPSHSWISRPRVVE